MAGEAGEQVSLIPSRCVEEGQLLAGGAQRSNGLPAHSSIVPRRLALRLLLPLLMLLLGSLVLAHRLRPVSRSSGAELDVMTAFKAKEDAGADAAMEVYRLLGKGSCINQTGAHTNATHDVPGAQVLPDASSPQCEKACSHNASCMGYTTIGDKCRMLTDKDFLPSAADGTEGSACFWRHKFINNTPGLYPADQKVDIPKILWSYWEVKPSASPVLLEFVKLCLSSWKKSSPNWEVRVLNEATLGQWLHHVDVPEVVNITDMSVAHRADIIRLALLNKYGGVWLDATSLLMRPLDDLFGSDRVRTFFNVPCPPFVPGSVDKRVDFRYHMENWILAAPPRDPFFQQITSCVLQFFRLPAEKRRTLEASGMFTKSQLQMAQFLRINAYISTTACIFKVIDEDAAIASWYLGNRSRHFNPVEHVVWWWYQPLLAKKVLWDSTNQTMVDTLITDVPVWKFDHTLRGAWIEPLTPKMLWCKRNTFHAVISKLGIENEKLCDDVTSD